MWQISIETYGALRILFYNIPTNYPHNYLNINSYLNNNHYYHTNKPNKQLCYSILNKL